MSTSSPTRDDPHKSTDGRTHPARQPTDAAELYRSGEIEETVDGETVYHCPRGDCSTTTSSERAIKCHYSAAHDARLVRFGTCDFCGNRFELDRDQRRYCTQKCVKEARRKRPDDPYQRLYVLYVYEDRSLEETAKRMPDHSRDDVRQMADDHDFVEQTLPQRLSKMDPEDLGL